MRTDARRLNLRLRFAGEDEELKRRIEDAAKKARRSQQSEIILRLRQTFSDDPVAA